MRLGAHQVGGPDSALEQVDARGPLGLDGGIGREHHCRSFNHLRPDVETEHGFARPGRGRKVQAPLSAGGQFLAGELDHLVEAMIEGGIQTAVVMLLVAASALLGVYLTEQQLPQRLAEGIAQLTDNRYTVLALLNLFFLVIGLEVRRELSMGELTERRRIIVPVLGALAGMAIPALLYLAINPAGEAANGWGVVIATDTALVPGALAIVRPASSTQLRIFLLTVAGFDDLVAVAVIGVVESSSLDLVALAVAGVSLAAIAVLSRRGEWRYSVYAVVLLVLWVATVQSGLHASIAGMASGLLIGAHPARRSDVERVAARFRAFQQAPLPDVGYAARKALQQSVSMNERLQVILHPVVAYVIVPLFVLANAGVDLRGGLLSEAMTSPVTWGVVAGLVAGKTFGIGVTTLTSSRLGVGPLPQGVGEGQVIGGAALSGIGFTVSLLIANLAFTNTELLDAATVGILLAAVLATLTAWVVFQLAAVLRGERTASRPMVLDRPVDPARDQLELLLLEKLTPNGIPILGICRGSQMINIFYGGTLHQDIHLVYEQTPRMRTVTSGFLPSL